MQYVFDDLSPVPEPNDDELKTYLELDAGQFRSPASLSFIHIYFSTDNGFRGAASRAMKILLLLNSGEVDPAFSGDRLLLPRSFKRVREKEIEKSFGKSFATSLFTLPQDKWEG